MNKRVTITRKIQLIIDSECKEQFNEELKKWKDYQYIVRKCANYISSHIFVQDNIQSLFYLTEEVKLKLTKNDDKNPDGVFNTSKQNTTYQVLSSHFKGEIPSSIMTSLNQAITKTYSEEKSQVMRGDKSLRSYRKNIPIPFSKKELRQLKKTDDANFSFNVFGTPFVTFFGRDKSYNRGLLERAFNELDGYKLHDSSILLEADGKKKLKIYLLAVISLPKTKPVVDADKEIHCFLDPLYPIVLGDKYSTKIGTFDDFTHGRVHIQNKLKELQTSLKYSEGGKGRTKKLQALERFKNKEKNFVQTKLHTYSRLLINHCLKYNIGKIVLSNYSDIESDNLKDSSDDAEKFMIRNWSYYGLSQMIMYKATMNNIEVVIPASSKENKKSIEKFVKEDVQEAVSV